MIYFRGIALENVAPVKIEDIRVSPISLSVTARQRPVGYGAEFVRIGGGSRSVQITFALLVQDISERMAFIQHITDWARSDTEGELIIPDKTGVYLSCICTALPEPSMRQWWESKLRLTFTTFDNPFWTSTVERNIACGNAFNVVGSAPPLMRIYKNRNRSGSNQSYSDGTNTMTFSTIPAGEMVIDLNRQTAAVGGTSIMQYYSFSSSFIPPVTGIQTITGNGTVSWRERWL